jgi:hypothetical protein
MKNQRGDLLKNCTLVGSILASERRLFGEFANAGTGPQISGKIGTMRL